MSVFILLFLLGFNKTYFDAIYSMEKMPFDSALSSIYQMVKTHPDSALCDITINYAKDKLSNMTVNDFLGKLNQISKGTPYIDSIFEIYSKKWYVYDTLLDNFLHATIYIKQNDKMQKELKTLYKRFEKRPDLVKVILYYAAKNKVSSLVNNILSRRDINLNDLDPDVLFELAEYFYKKEQYSKITSIFNTLSKKPLKGQKRLDFLKLKGIYFNELNNPDSALFYLSQYMESNGNMDLNLFKILLSLYIKKGYYKNAKDIVQILLKSAPFDYNIRKLAGYIYFMLEDYDSSLIHYLIAQSLAKNDAEIHYYIARVLVRKKDYKDALRSINKALLIQKNYSYALLKVFILYEMGMFDDAARELLVWKQRGRNDPYYLYLAGVVLKGMQRRKLSLSYLKKSILKDPTHPRRYIPILGLITVSKDTGFFKMVVDTVKNLTLTDNDDIFDLAFASQVIGYVKLSDSLYRSLITKNPKEPLYYNNLGYLHLEHGNLDTAEKYIKKAYHLSPKDPYIVDSYAWLLFKKGDIKKAYTLCKYAYKHTNDKIIKKHYQIIKHAFKKQQKKK